MKNIEKIKRLKELLALAREQDPDPACGLVDISLDVKDIQALAWAIKSLSKQNQEDGIDRGCKKRSGFVITERKFICLDCFQLMQEAGLRVTRIPQIYDAKTIKCSCCNKKRKPYGYAENLRQEYSQKIR